MEFRAAQALRRSLAAMVEIYRFEFMPRLLGLVEGVPPERLAPKKVK